jgi:hypothetical protein
MPFKDISKKRKYHKEKQAKIRQDAKITQTLHETEKLIIDEFRKQIVGRYAYPLYLKPGIKLHNLISDGIKLPILHIDFNPLDKNAVIEAVDKLAEEEDTLLLTGDHEGWSAFGIEGLATATGRNILKSKGTLASDILQAKKALGLEYMDLSRYAVFTSFRTSYISFEDPEVYTKLAGMNFYYSPYLFTKEGKQDNMIVMKLGEQTCQLMVGSDVSVSMISPDKAKVWEAISPIIHTPTNICEVTNIKYIS